jgi:hypothetical protein
MILSKRLILSVCLLGICTGCTPTKYSHVSVLENANQTHSGIHVDKIWLDEAAIPDLKNNHIALGQINTDSIHDEKGITKSECKEYLSTYIFNSIENGGFIQQQDNSMYKLNLYFTNMSPGDASSRIWAGELGFGHANVEIQAIVQDESNKRIIEISDSRNNSGAIGLRDTGGDKGPVLVKELIQQITDNILKELKAIIRK